MSESDIERIQRLQGELEATDRNHVGTDVYALAILSHAVLEVALQLAKSRNTRIAIEGLRGDPR